MINGSPVVKNIYKSRPKDEQTPLIQVQEPSAPKYSNLQLAVPQDAPRPAAASVVSQPVRPYNAPVVANTQAPFYCSNRENDWIAVNCSNVYYYCENGLATKMNCPSGLKFSKVDMVCEEPQFVPECNGKSRPVNIFYIILNFIETIYKSKIFGCDG